MDFFPTFYMPVELDDSFYSNSHTMSILSICDMKCCSTTLHLACQERKVHPPRAHEIGSIKIFDFSNQRLQLIKLFIRECRSRESHRIVGLWTAVNDGCSAVPAFINTLGQTIETFDTMDL